MAKDDMFVVMYKIIAYLYDCMKKGIEPICDMWDADAMGITEAYWQEIIDQLVGHDFISGVTVVRKYGNIAAIKTPRPRVTMEGVAFAQENTMMAKAKKHLQDVKASVPFI